MIQLIKLFMRFMNDIHDLLVHKFHNINPSYTDKDLHFIIIGIIGITIFLITDVIFKKLAKIKVEIISFIYTFTVLMVIVFGIEIEQKITGRGQMEFNDILYGVWGFIYIFIAYILIRVIIYLIRYGIKVLKKDNK